MWTPLLKISGLLLVSSLVVANVLNAGGGVPGDVRYQLESVSDDAVTEDALASTLRLRLGCRISEWQSWQAFIEFEDVRALGATDCDSTVNGRTNYAIVADPEDAAR